MRKFEGIVNTIEGMKKETVKIVKEIEKETKKVAKAWFGRSQAWWLKRIQIFKG